MNRIKKASTVVAVVVGCGLLGTLISFSVSDYWVSEDKITVTAPQLFQPGQLIEIDASRSTGTLTWAISPLPDAFRTYGKKACFVTDRDIKQYTIIISTDKIKKVITINLGYDHDITINEFQTEVISWIPVGHTKLELMKLAQSFRSIARIIDIEILTEDDQIIDATAWLTSDALGPALEKWKPFLNQLQARFEASPPTDIAVTWREVARALEAQDGAA